ncbi:hypothetical protein F5Y16DRAFT_367755 [Xylariaceae sp. FL0255]|nr:hypothetical protein F5Y16DRAFT_367755 [Xylariaceae sp. FL0255]
MGDPTPAHNVFEPEGNEKNSRDFYCAVETQTVRVLKRDAVDISHDSNVPTAGPPDQPNLLPAKKVRAAENDGISTPSGSSDVGKLACPYYKRNSHVRILPKSCIFPGFPSISRLKEHLYRCHTRPKNQCNRCNENFQSSASLVEHQRSAQRCEVSEVCSNGMMTPDQSSLLRCRSRLHKSDEEKWKSIYRVLFPDDDRIPNPYNDEPCGRCITTGDSRLLDEFRQYQLQHLPQLFETALATVPVHERTVASITALLPRLHTEVFDNFQETHDLRPASIEHIGASPNSHVKQIKDTVCDASVPESSLSLLATNPAWVEDDAALVDWLLGNTEKPVCDDV